MVKDSLPMDGSESSPWAHANRIQRGEHARSVGTAGDVDVLVAERMGALGDPRTDHDQRPGTQQGEAGRGQFLVEPRQQRGTGRGEDHLSSRIPQLHQGCWARMQAHAPVDRYRPRLGTAPGELIGDVLAAARGQPDRDALPCRRRQRRHGEHAFAVFRATGELRLQSGVGEGRGGAATDRDQRRRCARQPGPVPQRGAHGRPAHQHVGCGSARSSEAFGQFRRARRAAGVLQRHRQHRVAGVAEHARAGRGLGRRAGQQHERRLCGGDGVHAP
jgi:hypothetical protein